MRFYRVRTNKSVGVWVELDLLNSIQKLNDLHSQLTAKYGSKWQIEFKEA